MHYPDFFDAVPRITLNDPLCELLGTFVQGEFDISYLDVVKGSGHSCPTVAGAYLMSYHALKALYEDERALRGQIRVEFSQAVDEGTTGVIANVISYITGATEISGFKGLGGKFSRQALMAFKQAVPSVRFTRIEADQGVGKSVDLFYDPSSISPNPALMQLMPLVLKGSASPQQRAEFARLWQERVRRILIENFENQEIIRVEEV
ncbi:MAG: hypothetical protein IBX43_04005 [Campylobacterales bacterium]|nr:hypothetical protein [Campylobacterales bacterium]